MAVNMLARPATPIVLWKLIWWDTVTKHIVQDVRDSMWVWATLLEKCFVCAPCSLNDWNGLILQLLQVPLVCYGAFDKNQSINSPCLLTACHTVHFSGWNVVYTSMWISRGPEPCVLLVHEPIKVENVFQHWTTGSQVWWGTAAWTVRSPDRTCWL